MATQHPEIATRLRGKLSEWANELDPPGFDAGGLSKAANDYFDFYLDGKPPTRVRVNPQPVNHTESLASATGPSKLLWQIRNGILKQTADGVQISQARDETKRIAFVTRNGLNLAGPVTAKVVLKTTGRGQISLAWRTSKEKEFTAANRVNIAHKDSTEWQTLTSILPSASKVIHVRLQVPDGTTTIKSIELTPAIGPTATLVD